MAENDYPSQLLDVSYKSEGGIEMLRTAVDAEYPPIVNAIDREMVHIVTPCRSLELYMLPLIPITNYLTW